MRWRAELERGSIPILSTKNQLWSLTYLFGGKLSLAKRTIKIEKAYSFTGPCHGLGQPYSFGTGFVLLPFFFSVLTSSNILVAVVLYTDTN